MMPTGASRDRLPSYANMNALPQGTEQTALATEAGACDEVVGSPATVSSRVDGPTVCLPYSDTKLEHSPSRGGTTDTMETRTVKAELPGQPEQGCTSLGQCENEKLHAAQYDRHFALTSQALHKLASVVTSIDRRMSDMARMIDEQRTPTQQVDAPAAQQRLASADGPEAPGVRALERLSLALTQQHRDQQELLRNVQRLQNSVDAIKVAALQLHEQQRSLQEQCEAIVVANASSESFRMPISCYDVAVLSANSLLFATNKGVHEFSADGRELSRFLQDDLVVAIDAFSYDGRVAVLLRGGVQAKARTSSSSNQAAPSCGESQLVIMSRNGAISQSSAHWLEDCRYTMAWDAHYLATMPESGNVLVACGLGKPDIYCLTRSGELQFQMEAPRDVRALAATVEAVIVASSASPRGGDNCCVIGAYGDRGRTVLWEYRCADQVHDLCCDPWGGVYAAVKDGGAVLALSELRCPASGSLPGNVSVGLKEGRTATELVKGLTKPTHMSMDSRARRLVVLSYDGRIVNALKCKTRPIRLSTVL